jgi:two-component system LytT family sensor kinase
MEAESTTFVKEEERDLDADSVSERKGDRQADTVTIAVRSGDRLFGHLLIGKRHGGQNYQSEDLLFLEQVTGQLAGMLQNFERRAEQERQSRREERLRELAAEAELKALKAQINPHFLFNALNSLAELTRENSEATEKGIVDLSQVFRYALTATKRDRVELGEELDFLESYLAVEHIRFEDRLQYTIDVPAALRRCRIPPMIIQPLVENAVKHGITQNRAGGRVSIVARRNGGNLRISVVDNGTGFETESRAPGGNGVGLNNVRRRIEALNAGNRLEIKSQPGMGTTVSFEIPVAIAESVREEARG